MLAVVVIVMVRAMATVMVMVMVIINQRIGGNSPQTISVSRRGRPWPAAADDDDEDDNNNNDDNYESDRAVRIL